jgi:Holliday junction resolvasome RuvABC endonuclease subunit
MTQILGLDPANVTGYAHTDGYRGEVDLCRTLDKHPGQRLIRLSEWLEETLHSHKTDLIAAEDATFGSHNPQTQASHNELRGIIKLVAAEFGIDVKLFNPMTIKAFATGNGHATKDQMVRAAKTFYDLDVTNNVADAVFIMELAKRPDCWPKEAEKKTRRKVLPPQRGRRLFS